MKFTPAAAIFTSASPGPGSGTGNSVYSIASGPPNSLIRIACTFNHLSGNEALSQGRMCIWNDDLGDEHPVLLDGGDTRGDGGAHGTDLSGHDDQSLPSGLIARL